jgi:hypothetical protein
MVVAIFHGAVDLVTITPASNALILVTVNAGLIAAAVRGSSGGPRPSTPANAALALNPRRCLAPTNHWRPGRQAHGVTGRGLTAGRGWSVGGVRRVPGR